MKSKPDFDPEWPARSRRPWPIRSIRRLMVIVAAIGILLAGALTMARPPLSSMIRRTLNLPTSTAVPRRLAMLQRRGAVAQPDVFRSHRRDPLVIIAPESIDPGMVVQAPAWVDSKMVFARRADDWQVDQRELPEPAPRVHGFAPQVGPQYKVVPGPNGPFAPAGKPRRSLDSIRRR